MPILVRLLPFTSRFRAELTVTSDYHHSHPHSHPGVHPNAPMEEPYDPDKPRKDREAREAAEARRQRDAAARRAAAERERIQGAPLLTSQYLCVLRHLSSL